MISNTLGVKVQSYVTYTNMKLVGSDSDEAMDDGMKLEGSNQASGSDHQDNEETIGRDLCGCRN
jgi:hypothetical protein